MKPLFIGVLLRYALILLGILIIFLLGYFMGKKSDNNKPN